MTQPRQPHERALDYLQQHPGASPREVMRATGASGREVRAASGRLEKAGLLRRQIRRRRLLLAAGTAAAAGLVGAVYLAVTQRRDRAQQAEARLAEQRHREEERQIYAALDRRDAARVAEARERLTAPDEGLRLAALRYLAGVRAEVQPELLTPLLADPSARVRRAAIQLLGPLPGPGLEDALVELVSDAERPQEERLLGLGALRQRAATDRRALARRLLPLLLDPSAAVQALAHQTLGTLTGSAITSGLAPRERHQAWATLLEEAS